MARGSRRILWDVLEEHLEEAAFLWRQRERSLLAPDESLEELASGDEARLHAHLRALSVGGERVAERLLRPALRGEEPTIVGPACWALLASEGPGVAEVFEALASLEDGSRAGLLRALELSGHPGLDEALRAIIPTQEARARAEVLTVLTRRRADVSGLLARDTWEAEPGWRSAALWGARLVPTSLAAPRVRRALDDASPTLREVAMLTGLIHHLREPWTRCRRALGQSGGVPGRVALLAHAISGGAREAEALVGALALPGPRDEALWALGFCGRNVAAEALLKVVEEEGSWLAADSFATITGLPLDEDRFMEPWDDDAQEAGAAADLLEQQLPGPPSTKRGVRGAQVAAWWREVRGRFDSRKRYLLGAPWTTEGLFAAMERVSLRRRSVLAWEVAVRSRGACQVDPWTWSWGQRAQLAQARSLKLVELSLESVMTRET
ncbi:hypothetical protein ACN469_25990 [Corallococcus terminator]